MGHKASYSLQAAASSLASDRRETGDRRPEGRETAKSLVGGCVGVLRGLNFEEVPGHSRPLRPAGGRATRVDIDLETQMPRTAKSILETRWLVCQAFDRYQSRARGRSALRIAKKGANPTKLNNSVDEESGTFSGGVPLT